MTYADGKILATQDGFIGTLTFNNPERHNAMSLEMWRAAADAMQRFAGDSGVRVVVLTGAGGKAFVSGADISKFESERASAEAVAIYNAAVEHFQQTLSDFPKPTVAAIRGYCIGGGLGIVVSCDLRVANDSARFGIPAAKLGLGYGLINIQRLMRLIGPQFVNEMLFTARHLDAADALRMGLINRVYADADIESQVRELAGTIAANAPLTIRAVKRIVRELLRDENDRDVAACDELVRQCFESEDYKEGRRAFLEKRKPIFSGR